MTKQFASLLAVLALATPCFSQLQWNAVNQQYIDQYKDIAIEQMKKYNIPASITLAQGLLESGAGRSELTLRGNNHFGIKCHGWSGGEVYHDDDRKNECFRAYHTAYESYEDHSLFLVRSQRYKSLFSLKPDDYQAWAKGLKAAGYATNPQYATRLIDIIQLYKLYQYDKSKTFDKYMVDHAKDVPQNGQPLHLIKIYNKNYYVVARAGDTFKAIAAEIGISYKRLAKYNERSYDSPLSPGEAVWLKKKQKRAPKEYKGRLHHVRPQESMYSIAQTYGIRLDALYKMNGLSPDYSLKVGDRLKLR